MQIGLNIFAAVQGLSEEGILLPQLVSNPNVDGTELEGSALTADQSDGWSYDNAAATVTDRGYRLLIDGMEAVEPQATPSLSIPLNVVGSSYIMQLRVQVAEAPGIWSPWRSIAAGTVAALPVLSSPTALADGETGYTGSVTTDDGTGTLYWAITENAAPPALNVLKSGDNKAVTAVGIQNVAGGGLTPDTTYHIHFVQENAAAFDSARVSSTPFTTNAPLVGEPGAFGPGDWSIADLGTGGDARLTLSTLPDDGGTAFKAFFYNIDGGNWIPLPTLSTGAVDLVDVFTDDIAVDVRLLAENLFGLGPESAPKSITTTTAPVATIPAAFGGGDWSVAANGQSGNLDVTLTTLPNDGGSAITAVEYRLDGGTWVDLGGTQSGSYAITGLTNGTAYAVELRAINAEGAGPGSTSQTATPSTVPEAFAPGDWSITDLGTGGDAQITLSALPDDGGLPIQIVQYSLDGGTWQGISGSNSTGNYTLNDVFTDGVATDVRVRSVNANGAGAASASKSVTTTPAASPPAAFAAGNWSVSNSAVPNEIVVDITALPADGGNTITAIEYRIDSGVWTAFSGTGTGSYTISGIPGGVAVDVTLRAVNAIGAGATSDTKSVIANVASSAAISIDDVSFSEGSGGSGPNLTITTSETEGTPTYTLFGATHPTGTTLSKTDIETGSGAAMDIFTASAATIDALDSNIVLNASITNGCIALFIRDSAGVPVESAVYEITGVDVDATAPTLSSALGTSTGQTSIAWAVTSNEAMGTTYAGIRLATDAALTAAQLIAGSGGTGIAFDNDELSADNGNNGDFSGLTEGTGYVIDTVAVDDWGNVSNVVSSATVTTDAAPVAGDIAPFVEQHAFSGASGTNGVYTISGVTLGTSGEVYIGYAASHPGQSGDPSSFTVGGVAATEVAKNIAQSRLTTAVYKVSPSSATGDVVINVGANLSDGGAIYVWKADTALTTTATATAIEPETNPTPPVDLDVSVNVAANGKVLVVGASVGGSGTVWDRASGVTEITGAQIDTDSGDHVNAWEASELSAETPRTVSVGFGLENPTFISAAAISLETL